MPNFSSIIIKNKSVFISFFLILLFLIIFFPIKTLAVNGGPGMLANLSVQFNESGEDCVNNLSMYQSITTGIVDILLLAPKIICNWITWLASKVINNVISRPVTTEIIFISGWSSIRDLANMLIVLGFVVVGIATTLRIREYEAKKFLGPLLIIAILINFSGLFCGLIIDASTLTMKGLATGTSTMGSTFYAQIEATEKTSICTALQAGEVGNYITISVMYGFIYLAITICFFYLACMLIARYAVLGILFMLSPLAFVFWAFPFPQAKKLWSQWWENFLKWAFIGVGICFFLNITGRMLQTFSSLEGESVAMGTIIFNLSMVLITLIVGIKVSTKSSAMGAAAVMGLASGGVSLAMGAAWGGTKGLGKMAANMSGTTAAGKYIGDVATRIGERTGLVSKGTLAQREQSRSKEAQGRISGLSSDKQKKIANGFAYTAEQKANKGAAIRTLMDNGRSHELTDIEKSVNYVTSRSVRGKDEIGELSKKDYRIAEHDAPRVKKYMDTHSLTGITGEKTAKAAVRQEQLEENWKSMETKQRQNVDTDHLSDNFLMERTDSEIRAFRNPSTPPTTQVFLRNRLAALKTNIKTAIKTANTSGDVSEERKLTRLFNEWKRI